MANPPSTGKPTLSASKISTYLACPTRFRWTFVDPRGRWYLRAKPTFSFGLTLHKVLERFHEHGAVDPIAQVLESYEESWVEAGFSSAEEMADAFGEGKEILERYVDEVRRTPATAHTLLVEQSLRLDLGPFVLVGRLDRVDEEADGTLEILDYKSGREPVEVRTELAMGCYALLLRERFPGRAIRGTVVALRSGSRATSLFSSEELDAFQNDLVTLGETILKQRFESLEPRAIALCRGCEFVPLCAKHPGWRAEAAIPRRR